MSRKLLIESSEASRSIIEYALLTRREINSRIRSYEKKYGMPFSRYSKHFDCDSALPWGSGDLIDWENLIQESNARQPKPDRKRHLTYGNR